LKDIIGDDGLPVLDDDGAPIIKVYNPGDIAFVLVCTALVSFALFCLQGRS